MTADDILTALAHDSGVFPAAALRAANELENKHEIIPGLLNFITYAKNNAEAIFRGHKKYFTGHSYALYLLAQFRERAALDPVIDLIGSFSENITDRLLGDIVTEDLHRILASLCGGDTHPIRALIARKDVPEYVRGACVESMVNLVACRIKTRDEVIGYYAGLFRGGLEREPSQVWNDLVGATALLNPHELYAEIEKADKEELFDLDYIEWEEIEEAKDFTIEQSMQRLMANKRYGLMDDAIAAMHWWSICAEPLKQDLRIYDAPDIYPTEPVDDYDDDDVYNPPQTRPLNSKIGRNEFCPCGSGKKYKKCCGHNS